MTSHVSPSFVVAIDVDRARVVDRAKMAKAVIADLEEAGLAAFKASAHQVDALKREVARLEAELDDARANALGAASIVLEGIDDSAAEGAALEAMHKRLCEVVGEQPNLGAAVDAVVERLTLAVRALDGAKRQLATANKDAEEALVDLAAQEQSRDEDLTVIDRHVADVVAALELVDPSTARMARVVNRYAALEEIARALRDIAAATDEDLRRERADAVAVENHMMAIEQTLSRVGMNPTTERADIPAWIEANVMPKSTARMWKTSVKPASEPPPKGPFVVTRRDAHGRRFWSVGGGCWTPSLDKGDARYFERAEDAERAKPRGSKVITLEQATALIFDEASGENEVTP